MFSYEDFKKEFEKHLRTYIKEWGNKYASWTGRSDHYSFVWEYAQTLSQKGKRLRPYNVYVSYSACGGKDISKIMGTLVSIELLHLAFLVHDDVIDRAHIRHGEEAANYHFKHYAEKNREYGESAHTGISNAILLGDLLFHWSADIFEVAGKSFDEKIRDESRKYFLDMVGETILGEIIDVDLSTRTAVEMEEVDIKNYLKTASYSFIKPMQIGAVLAEAGDELTTPLEKIGAHLGCAFQMQDDYLDIVASEKEIQKDAFLDFKGRQRTYFTEYLLTHGTDEIKREFNRYFGKDTLTEEGYKKVRHLFEESGALRAGKKVIEERLDQAEREIEVLPLEKGGKEILRAPLSLIAKRV